MATYNILLGTHTNIVGEIVFFGFTRVTGQILLCKNRCQQLMGILRKVENEIQDGSILKK